MRIFEYIADRLIARAKRTPYSHIINGVGLTQNPDEADYMERYWLFNPYESSAGGKPIKWLPSVRIHRIKKSDDDRALHDHPWRFVTVILKGGYYEVRPVYGDRYTEQETGCPLRLQGVIRHETKWHGPGSILIRSHKDFHRLVVPEGGEAWTMFTTGKYLHKWGFLHRDSYKIAYDTYLKVFGKRAG